MQAMIATSNATSPIPTCHFSGLVHRWLGLPVSGFTTVFTPFSVPEPWISGLFADSRSGSGEFERGASEAMDILQVR